MKRRSNFLVVFILSIFVLSNFASAVSINYKSAIMVLPYSEKTVYIEITADQIGNTLHVDCESDLSIECPDNITISNESEKIPIYFKTQGAGNHNITVKIDDSLAIIDVKVTSTIKTLLDILNKYNKSISSMKARAPKEFLPRINKLESEINEAYSLYENDSYNETNEKIREIQVDITKLLNDIKESGKNNANAAPVDEKASGYPLYIIGGVVAMILLIGAMIFAFRPKKKKKIEFGNDLSTIKRGISSKKSKKKE
ncbi:MAG: hypothetical protein J7K87_02390 [Candidatus Aenigmarchaeota archaeon]|nr:hypothetical protein [Candidatus Aenigmarchaeota archaeon]